ncbi:hypothetical protein M9Y10_004030 [Tritrichomonas musculus]|uniref:Alcohol dehydrogenase n=1 Tax=Tritrichomonas musculus TaxID=1915356 RepID=A0ABR2JQV9_9EUKA
MKGIYFDGKSASYREDIPIPTPGEDESLVRVSYANVCSTDKEILRGYCPNFTGVMGHEFSGIVEKSSLPELVGKEVVGEINDGCCKCFYCLKGLEKHCPYRKTIGIGGKDGCFSQYITVSNHCLHVLPKGLTLKEAVFCEPLAAAIEIVSQLHVSPEMKIAVIGDGRLAFMITQILALQGGCVTVFGKHEEKLLSFEKYAKTIQIESIKEKVIHPIDDTFDIVVESCGNPSGLELACKIIRCRGTIVLKSTYAGKCDVNMSFFVVNEITLVGSRCGPFEPALNLLARHLINLPEPELYQLKDFEKAFTSSAFKAGFDLSLENSK